MKVFLILLTALLPSLAFGSDADRGREIAQQQCAACHVIGRDRGQELANAPPFEIIGRRVGFDEKAVAVVVRGPHPKMNFAVTGRDATDIAAYISTLVR